MNDGELNDGELNDGELGRELSALTPDPAADYWTRIDAMLAGVEAERRGDSGSADGPAIVGGSSLGEASQQEDRADTDQNVVRLTDMNQPRDLLHRFNRQGGPVLVAAASIVVLLAVAGLLVLRDDSTNIDATVDDTTTESTPPPDEETTDTTARSNDQTTDTTATPDDGADGSETAAPIAATYCFGQADVEQARGEQATRLVVREDGTAVAVQRFRTGAGQDIITEATGFVLDETEGTFAMTADLDGQTLTRIWRISDGGLSTDIESFYTTADCAAVDQVLDGVTMPQPVVPEPETIDTALDPATYCWLGEDVIRGFYELTIGNDGSASVRAYAIDDSITPVVTMIESGTGVFATANEIALNVERWTPDGITADSILYTISGDQLQPTIYPGFLATPVDCSTLDEWRLSDESLNVYTDQDLTFESADNRVMFEGGFIRGEVNIYRLEGNKGQRLTVTISSLEDNAAVEVRTPDGLAIVDNEDGGGDRSVVLPESGVYPIIVSSIRGNVDFTLVIETQ